MVRIREATREDAAVLADLIGRLAAHQNEGRFMLATAETLARDVFDRGEGRFLIAEDDEGPLGYLSWQRRYSIWMAGDYLYLDDLYVVDRARGGGVGARLMRALAEIAVGDGLRLRWEMQAENTAARRFYEWLGAQMSPKVIARWSLDAMKALADRAPA